MTVFHACLDTQHFRFDAYGETAAKARKALRTGLLAHAKQCHISLTWFEPFRGCIVVNRVELGDCLRDYQPLTVKGDSSWLT